MKFRAFISPLLAVVVLLLSLGIAGFWWITASSPLSAITTAAVIHPTTTFFVSKQSPALVSLLINPDQLETLRLVDAPLRDRKQIHREMEQFKRKLLAGTGLDYQQDVQPWLGDEVTLAVTAPDLDRNSETGYQPGYLLIVTTRDAAQSQAFLERLWQKQAASRDLVFEPYGGVKLIYSTPRQPEQGASDNTREAAVEAEDSVTLATAQVGDRFVLFGNSAKVIREAITNAQAKDLNLDSSDLYQQALGQATVPRLGIGFFNLPRTLAWLTDEAIPFAEDTTTHLFDGLLVTLDVEQGGLLAQTTLLAPPDQTLLQATPALSAPVTALKFVPESSPLVAAGQNLQSLWQEIEPELDSYAITHKVLSQSLQRLQQAWGISSWSDLVGWVDGEYALSLMPLDKQAAPDWVFAAEKTPRVEAAIAHFDEIAQQQRLTAGAIDLEGQPAIVWTKLLTLGADRRRARSLQAVVQAVHTTVGSYEIFASSLDALNQSLIAAQSPELSPSLQQAIAILEADNDGYFYVDWDSLKSWVVPKLSVRRLAEVTQFPFVESVRSLTISGYGTEMNWRKGGIFLQLSDF